MTLRIPEGQDPDLAITVDSEHAGVRILGCLAFFLGTVAAYFLLSSLFVNSGLLIFGAALAFGVALTYGADFLSKRYIPSKRSVLFVRDHVLLVKGEKIQAQIDAGQDVKLLQWHFESKRHPRVPKGWYVVANALEQDGEMISSYSIVSPEDFVSLPLARLSEPIQRKKRGEGDLRKAGNQRRIAHAEFHRTDMGAEMSPEDYRSYLEYLGDTYTSWMPKEK